MTFHELISNKSYDELELINYFDLLRCEEWKNKRQIILKRDSFRCTKCNKTYTIKVYSGQNTLHLFMDKTPNPNNEYINLQIHHSLYIYNKLPWEYDDEILITLCNLCHQNLHNNEDVMVWDEQKYNKLIFGSCERCGGKGYIKEYRNIQNGICFKCRGYGYSKPLINLNEKLTKV